MFENTLIYLLGFPGTGKYTVAKIFADKAHVRLIDNQLINNPIFSVLRVDGKTPLPTGTWGYVTRVWQAVLDAMVDLADPKESFVLTNVLWDKEPGDHEHYHRIKDIADRRQALFIPVRLFISDKAEHAKRISMPERELRMKQTDASQVAEYTADRMIQIQHDNLLDLDVSKLSPDDVFAAIAQHIQGKRASL